MVNMKLCLGLVLFLEILHQGSPANDNLWPSQNECGKVNVDSFYKPTNATDLNEYPWIAQVAIQTSIGDNSVGYKCLAVLITQRYLLSPAHCYERNDMTVDHVLLGNWNPNNDPNERDCDEYGKCAPVPKKYQVEDVAIHPDHKRHINDLALLRLQEKVIFNEFISPVCMPPPSVANADYYTGQFLPFVGYAIRDAQNYNYKIKYLLHVTSPKSCEAALTNFRITLGDKHWCGISSGDKPLMSGSALMGLRLVNGEPNNFFLAGLVTAGAQFPGSTVPDVFMRVASYMDWINFNVVA